jgi:hypothetical protein
VKLQAIPEPKASLDLPCVLSNFCVKLCIVWTFHFYCAVVIVMVLQIKVDMKIYAAFSRSIASLRASREGHMPKKLKVGSDLS